MKKLPKRIKLIIAGSRSITDRDIVGKAIAFAGLQYAQIAEVVSGTAYGVDKLGEWWAEKHNIPIKKFPANWKNVKGKPENQIGRNKYGSYFRLAGYERNVDMANYADALLAVWKDGSKGTEHMIKTMKELDKHYWVYEL